MCKGLMGKQAIVIKSSPKTVGLLKGDLKVGPSPTPTLRSLSPGTGLSLLPVSDPSITARRNAESSCDPLRYLNDKTKGSDWDSAPSQAEASREVLICEKKILLTVSCCFFRRNRASQVSAQMLYNTGLQVTNENITVKPKTNQAIKPTGPMDRADRNCRPSSCQRTRTRTRGSGGLSCPPG